MKTLSVLILAAGLIGYWALSGEYKLILKNYHYGTIQDVELVFPIPGLNPERVENTFHAPRPGGRRHQGIDLHFFRGMPVVSMTDGTVVFKGRNTLGGNVISILGDDNRLYYYAHLSGFGEVEAGYEVKAGQVIGAVGNTGNAAGTLPHLHLEIMIIRRLIPFSFHPINPWPELMACRQSVNPSGSGFD